MYEREKKGGGGGVHFSLPEERLLESALRPFEWKNARNFA